MIQKFNQYNESLRDKMVGKSDEDINVGLNDIIKKLEDIINSDDNTYDYDAFTAESFINFIASYFGLETSEDIVMKLMELKYIDAQFALSEWVEGVDAVSDYSVGDSKAQLENFLDTIKELKQ